MLSPLILHSCLEVYTKPPRRPQSTKASSIDHLLVLNTWYLQFSTVHNLWFDLRFQQPLKIKSYMNMHAFTYFDCQVFKISSQYMTAALRCMHDSFFWTLKFSLQNIYKPCICGLKYGVMTHERWMMQVSIWLLQYVVTVFSIYYV